MSKVKSMQSAAQLVEEFIELRDAKSLAKQKYTEFCQVNFESRMNEIQDTLLAMFSQLGIDSIASPSGTAYKHIATSVTTADMREFRRHVIGTEQWDLADWKPNKTLINEMVERGEPIPPGVNRSATQIIGIRRKS